MPNAKTTCFVDTNLLVYAVDPAEPEKRALAADWLRRMVRNRTLVLSAQSLNECYRVIADRRRTAPRHAARGYIETLRPFCTAPSGCEITGRAWRIQDDCGFPWSDCLLLASAAAAGCTDFLSEDMQHERSGDGVTMLDAFKLEPHHITF